MSLFDRFKSDESDDWEQKTDESTEQVDYKTKEALMKLCQELENNMILSLKSKFADQRETTRQKFWKSYENLDFDMWVKKIFWLSSRRYWLLKVPFRSSVFDQGKSMLTSVGGALNKWPEEALKAVTWIWDQSDKIFSIGEFFKKIGEYRKQLQWLGDLDDMDETDVDAIDSLYTSLNTLNESIKWELWNLKTNVTTSQTDQTSQTDPVDQPDA